MSEKLKPCPFCGGDAYLHGSERDGFYICCISCYCGLGENYDRSAMPDHMFRTEDYAVEQWNRRPEPTQPTAGGSS